MDPKLRKTLLVVLAVIFVVSLGGFISSLLDYQKGDQVNAEADALIELPDFTALSTQAVVPEPNAEPEAAAEPYIDPYADALAAMDFAALRQVNSEVLGWIIIPDTSISYPLLQHNNNQYYLGHNWKGGSSRVGSIFLEATNSPSLTDFNTIIYGHRMNNGSMFTPLQKFQKQDFWAAHPSVYITTNAGSQRYDIFAAYEVSTEGMTYALGFSGDKAKQRFIDFCLEQSVLDTGIVPEVQDYILTLSTCTGHGHATRWVVQAVRRGEKPEQESNPNQTDTEIAPNIEPDIEPNIEPETEPGSAPEPQPASPEPADDNADDNSDNNSDDDIAGNTEPPTDSQDSAQNTEIAPTEPPKTPENLDHSPTEGTNQ